MKHNSLQEKIKYINALGFFEKDFFKFISVRNPWDIVVSWYFFEIKRGSIPKDLRFSQYIQFKIKSDKHFLDLHYFAFNNSKYSIDYAIRYESYEEDVKKIFQKYNVTWNVIYYRNFRPKNTDYRTFYTKDNKKIIDKQAESYIDLFKYTF
jgi:hypothetical protein